MKTALGRGPAPGSGASVDQGRFDMIIGGTFSRHYELVPAVAEPLAAAQPLPSATRHEAVTTAFGGTAHQPAAAAADALQAKALSDTLAGLLPLLVQKLQERAQPPRASTMPGAEDHAFEQRVVELVNAERARHGLRGLRYDSRLDLAAERHNAQQAVTGIMAHQGIGDGDPGSRARSAGWTRGWGENVAVGQRTPEQVVAEWMASPGHRRNILDPAFTSLSVAYTVGANGRPYWSQAFGA